jgi:hypothetical protein
MPLSNQINRPENTDLHTIGSDLAPSTAHHYGALRVYIGAIDSVHYVLVTKVRRL